MIILPSRPNPAGRVHAGHSRPGLVDLGPKSGLLGGRELDFLRCRRDGGGSVEHSYDM